MSGRALRHATKLTLLGVALGVVLYCGYIALGAL